MKLLPNNLSKLSNSLGYYSSKIKNLKPDLLKKSVNKVYTCYIYANTNNSIPSKIYKINYSKVLFNDLFTSEFKVEYDGHYQYYGFTVDDNHRFLLKDCSVVHNTGKSTLISSLLFAKRNVFPMGIVCSGTEDSNHYWETMFPSSFIYNRADLDKIQDFVSRQKYAKQHLKNPWGLLLLDDCTDDPKIFNDTVFHGLFKNGRHWKMLFILSLQYPSDIKPVLRSNIDYSFILRETNMKNRKTLWENYAGVIPDFKMFCEIMDSITTDYTALVIDNTSQSNKIEDCVFFYKPKIPPRDFKFGSVDFWNHHYARIDPNYKDNFGI